MKQVNNEADSAELLAGRAQSDASAEPASPVSDAVESDYRFSESAAQPVLDSEKEILQSLHSEPAKPEVKKPKIRTRSKEKAASRAERTPAKSTAFNERNFADPSFTLSAHPQSVNQNSDRIAIFIDGSNLFYAASHLNIEVDYRRLLSSLVRGRRLLRAYFYTGVDPQNEKQRGFLLWLNRHGHRVVSKELTHMPDGSRKANMHVEMAVDMMRIAEYCPTLTLLGGDGNLAYALKVLSQRGTFIEVVSLQSMTSDSLIDLADSYTDLADLRDDIKR